MNMLALERRNHIVEKLQDEKKVYVSDLAAEYGVSEETIRRDLDRLDREGIATKSYGGAVFNETAAAGSTEAKDGTGSLRTADTEYGTDAI